MDSSRIQNSEIMRMIKTKKSSFKFILLSLGLIDSFYLLITTYLEYLSQICPLQGCSYLTYNGINLPALSGFMWFAIYPFLKSRLLNLWQICGIIGIIFLGSTAILNSYFCPYCFFAYCMAIVLISIDRFV